MTYTRRRIRNRVSSGKVRSPKSFIFRMKFFDLADVLYCDQQKGLFFGEREYNYEKLAFSLISLTSQRSLINLYFSRFLCFVENINIF